MKDSNFKPGLRAHPPFLLFVVWSFLNQVDTQAFKWKGAECQRCARQGQHVVGLEAWPSGPVAQPNRTKENTNHLSHLTTQVALPGKTWSTELWVRSPPKY